MKHAARENKRIYLMFYLRVFEDGEFLGFVIDISPKGMMIISEAAMTPDRIYELRMKLPPDIKNTGSRRDSVVFNAKCRWSRPDEDNISFFLNGFEIGEIGSDAGALIEKTINEYRLR